MIELILGLVLGYKLHRRIARGLVVVKKYYATLATRKKRFYIVALYDGFAVCSVVYGVHKYACLEDGEWKCANYASSIHSNCFMPEEQALKLCAHLKAGNPLYAGEMI